MLGVKLLTAALLATASMLGALTASAQFGAPRPAVDAIVEPVVRDQQIPALMVAISEGIEDIPAARGHGDAALRSGQHLFLGAAFALRARLDPQYPAVGVSQNIQQSVRPLPDIADALAEMLEQPFLVHNACTVQLEPR
jgi:hypothetical protein